MHKRFFFFLNNKTSHKIIQKKIAHIYIIEKMNPGLVSTQKYF